MTTDSSPAAFRFVHRLRVRWAEVDMQNIVFNGHYLTWFDEAFTDFLEQMGFETVAPHHRFPRLRLELE